MDRDLLRFYFSFEGRATRRDFNLRFAMIYFFGWLIAALMDLTFSNGYIFEATKDGPFVTAWSLIMLVPTFAVTARRLHDMNYSGWWQLAICGVTAIIIAVMALTIGASFLINPLAAGLGGIFALLAVLILFLAFFVMLSIKRGTKGSNRYGPDPLEVKNERE